MPSVQSVFKQTKLSRRQRRAHRYSATTAPQAAPAASTAGASSSNALPKAYRNTVPIVHGIVVSNLSLVLLQKEYIEQFYFEKRIGGGGPDANADSYRHLNGKHQPHNRFNTQLQLLRFG